MFPRRRSPDDFAAEIESHLQLERDRLQEQGLSEDEAHAAARRNFGNVARAEERFYESRRWRSWDHVCQDVRYGARMMGKSRGFTAIAVMTMALGIGATTAMFGVVDATLLRPLPYPRPEQLVSIEDNLPGVGSIDVGLSEPEWQDLQHSDIFENVAPVWFDENNLTGTARPTRVGLMSVAPNYFAVLGVKPQLGRPFNPKDRSPGYNLEVLISDGLWKRAFGGASDILDKSVRLDTDLYRIVGVMPASFHDPGRTAQERNVDVWAATSFYGAPMADHPPRNKRNLPGAIARLGSGLTLAGAQSRVDQLVATLQKEFPGDYPRQSGWTVRLVPLKETVVGNVRQSLILLLAAVGLVLVVGCANVANLLLARASARGSEMSIRQALGADRTRLARQLLTESVMLSVGGGVAALVILYGTKDFLLRLVPESFPQVTEISMNWGVLLFALTASLATGTIFGLVPALFVDRHGTTRLKPDRRGSTGSAPQTRSRRILVAAQFAVSLVLLVAAGLLLRSFWDLLNARLGFDPERVMTVRTRLPYPNDPKADRYGTIAQQVPFFREILRVHRTLCGVQEVALGNSTSVPLDHALRDLNQLPLILEGRAIEETDAPLVDASVVTPEYFHLLGMTVLAGRVFTDFDDDHAPGVVMVNQSMAQRYWPGENALGKHLKLSRASSSWSTVVGIVADARTESLDRSGVSQVYASLYQEPAKHLALFLRGDFEVAAIPQEVRDHIHSVDATLPVFGAHTLNDTVTASLAERRFSLQVVALFAVTTLLMAGLGIYGVISYLVSERTREIGIRLALGADDQNILSSIFSEGIALTTAGAAVGLVCALIVSQIMARELHGVRPADPLTYVVVAALLVAVALLACYIPARRAIRVDPLIALRHD